nr:Zinc finger domain containing protein [Haemonchus contortus]
MASENDTNHTVDAGVNSRQVSGEQEFAVENLSEVLDEVIEEIRQGPVRIEKDLTEARIAGKYRAQLMRVWDIQAEQACDMLKDVKARARGYKLFGSELFRELQEKGIESMDDWNEYARVTERDGEILAEICDMFQTDVAHIRGVLKELPRNGQRRRLEPGDDEEKMETDENGESSDMTSRMGHTLRNGSIQGPLRRQIPQTGAPCGQVWRQHSEPSEEAIGTSGQDLLNVMALIQANACVSPGVFKGNSSNENFEEFIRRFTRKYRTVIFDDKTLLDIMVDDHLEGRAKTVFLSLPSSVREQGFDAVVRELRKLLANDSTAGRLRALTELRSLKRRWGQSVADFCVVLEKLGRQANPACSIKERSLEYAQILLDNLTDWPEHVHLLSTLHRVDPTDAYDAVKELALTMEQSRYMMAPIGSTRKDGWKRRSAAYQQEGRKRDLEARGSRDIGSGDAKPGSGYREGNIQREAPHPIPNEGVRKSDMDGGPVREHGRYSNGHGERRRCYNCQKIGHIGRDCPLKRAQVNQIAEEASKQTTLQQKVSSREETTQRRRISSIISGARSLGVKCGSWSKDETPLVGSSMTVEAKVLDLRVPAIVDTGSMISIIPVGILARAQKEGYDVDSLEVLSEDSIIPVFDASRNRMDFLGAVKIAVELEEGNKVDVAFHIADDKEAEILLGTNALGKLGIQVVLPPQEPTLQAEASERVVVARRMYIPPYGKALVSARHEGGSDGERILWPTKDGFAAGVFKITNQEVKVPMINNSEEPMILREGEEIRPLMMDSGTHELTPEERRKVLHEQVRQSTGVDRLSEEVKNVLDEFPEAFSICDRELSKTDRVKMDIDTGEHKPIKMKARPVPLGVRKKLKELLTDLENRKIIEKSSSEWAFPIVLVEKKDGSMRLCVDYRELNNKE